MKHEIPNLAEQVTREVFLDFLLWTAFARTGFSLNQRKAIVNRDCENGMDIPGNKGHCQYPLPHKCNGDKGLQVHHLRPVSYSEHLGVDPNFPYNGLSICKEAHVSENGIHADTAKAEAEFRKGDKDAFKRMSEVRKEKMEERTTYWNTDADRPMDVLAIRNTQKAEKKGWSWPWVKHRDINSKPRNEKGK